MSVFSGDGGKVIVRALRGKDVVLNEKTHHVKLSIAKSHERNKDNEVVSPEETSKITCTDGDINITTEVLNVNSNTNFGNDVNVQESIYLGGDNEEFNAEILKELKALLNKTDDYNFIDLDWGYLNE